MLPTLLIACAPVGADDARTAWIVDTLAAENRVWASRDPSLLAAKYAKMAADPYDFLRGTAGMYQADLARPGVDRIGLPFGLTPELTQVLVAGDPHPENFGTFLADDPPTEAGLDAALTLEVADLDGAGFGPYTLDVRRAALGVALTLEQGGCDDACRRPALEAIAAAYADEAAGRTALDPTLADGTHGALVDELLEDARAEGLLRGALIEATYTQEDGSVALTLDAALDAEGAGTLALTANEAAQVERLAWSLPDGARVLDVARLFGKGVSSLPAVRYLALWDRGDDGPDDDDLFEAREIVDPPALAGLGALNVGVFASNADRLARASARVWSSPTADPRAAWLEDGPMSFKRTSATDWFQGFNHRKIAEDLAEGAYTDADVAAWSALLGQVLAANHQRAGTLDGDAPPIGADLAGREDTWQAAVADVAEADLVVLLADHARFVDALERLGPTLGADQLATDPVPW
jgi:uncharacterized protein (DUF2252 family)